MNREPKTPSTVHGRKSLAIHGIVACLMTLVAACGASEQVEAGAAPTAPGSLATRMSLRFGNLADATIYCTEPGIETHRAVQASMVVDEKAAALGFDDGAWEEPGSCDRELDQDVGEAMLKMRTVWIDAIAGAEGSPAGARSLERWATCIESTFGVEVQQPTDLDAWVAAEQERLLTAAGELTDFEAQAKANTEALLFEQSVYDQKAVCDPQLGPFTRLSLVEADRLVREEFGPKPLIDLPFLANPNFGQGDWQKIEDEEVAELDNL